MTGEAPTLPSRDKTERLRQRTDFLKVRSGKRIAGRAFTLQFAERDVSGPARFGFTVTRKVGNAVERNRIRRRLKEVVRLSEGVRALSGHDYVLVARRPALHVPFTVLADELAKGLDRCGGGRPDKAGR